MKTRWQSEYSSSRRSKDSISTRIESHILQVLNIFHRVAYIFDEIPRSLPIRRERPFPFAKADRLVADSKWKRWQMQREEREGKRGKKMRFRGSSCGVPIAAREDSRKKKRQTREREKMREEKEKKERELEHRRRRRIVPRLYAKAIHSWRIESVRCASFISTDTHMPTAQLESRELISKRSSVESRGACIAKCMTYDCEINASR